MNIEEIFEKANALIDSLNLIDDNNLLYYIINNVESNGYCSIDEYQEELIMNAEEEEE